MANAFNVADFFISLSNSLGDNSFTNLKLNKMLYFAQGTTLERFDKELFSEDFEAWEHGPVVRQIYNKYKQYKNLPIKKTSQTYSENIFSDDELEVLIDVLREYGKFSGSHLRSLTHATGTPWQKVFVKDSNKIITKEVIKDFFKKNPTPKFKLNKKANPITILPKEWYDSKEDDIWKAYL